LFVRATNVLEMLGDGKYQKPEQRVER
jgi:hypothetical protein